MIRVKGFVALAAMLALVGCKPLEEAINGVFYKGTLAGAEKCMELKSSTLVSKENVKAACVAEFEDDVPHRVGAGIDGTGSPTLNWGQRAFSGSLTNTSPDWVITQIKIEVSTLKADKSVDRNYYATTRVWIEPGQKNFQLMTDQVEAAPDNWDQIDKCKECWTWSIVEAKGLEM